MFLSLHSRAFMSDNLYLSLMAFGIDIRHVKFRVSCGPGRIIHNTCSPPLLSRFRSRWMPFFSLSSGTYLGRRLPTLYHFSPEARTLPVCGISHGEQLPLVTVGETSYVDLCRGILKACHTFQMILALSLLYILPSV
jgi:hypothetical protein